MGIPVLHVGLWVRQSALGSDRKPAVTVKVTRQIKRHDKLLCYIAYKNRNDLFPLVY